MPSQINPTSEIRLVPLSGPGIATIDVSPDARTVMGRSSTCTTVLPDETMSVSREHAAVFWKAGEWYITDENSRHGTFLNDVRLDPQAPAPLREEDRVRIGPWVFAVRGVGQARRSHHTTLLADANSTRIERIQATNVAALAQHRFDLLMELAAGIASADSMERMASAALDALVEGAGFPRASILVDAGKSDTVGVIASRSRGDGGLRDGEFSSSLIREARRGDPVLLRGNAPMAQAMSVLDLGIDEAICAPISVGSNVAAYLYVDTRGRGERLPQDAQTFAQAVARMCGLAMANIQRIELQRRTEQMVKDLDAAREAQRLLIPPEFGAHGALRYAMRMRSGRFVAGDHFDLVPFADGPLGVILGDVSGKGIGAAILMAAAQSRLHAAMQRERDPARAVQEVNTHVLSRSADNSFITLWAGVIDPVARTIAFVDAGHGCCLYKPPGAPPRRVRCEGNLVLGVRADEAYKTESIAVEPGGRLILFSDGFVEQRGAGGGDFGFEGVISALTESQSPGDDIEAAFEAVIAFAGTDSLSDDATIASIEIGAA